MQNIGVVVFGDCGNFLVLVRQSNAFYVNHPESEKEFLIKVTEKDLKRQCYLLGKLPA